MFVNRLSITLFSLLFVCSASADEVAPDAWDAMLREHVTADGWVDYAGFAGDAGQVDAYIAGLADADLEVLSEDDRLATLINAYNAFTVRLIMDYYNDGKLTSIMDIPEDKRWDHQRWTLGGQVYSLNQIEHELIRAKFKEPRIHFALVCAAYSCPKLRNEAYTGAGLEAQLADQTVYTHSHDRWLVFDTSSNTLHLTALYDWYGGDFKVVADSVLDYVAEQAPAVRAAIEAGHTPEIIWLDYDWKLNDISNKP